MRLLMLLPWLALALLAGCSPETPEHLSVRAEEAYASGQWAKAIVAYERLLEVAGENPVTYRNLALAAYRAQDSEYAKAMVAKALALKPSEAEAERCRELQGMVLEEEKDLAGAARAYRALTAAKDAGIRVRARSRLARLYADQGRPDGAFALLLASVNERPTDATTLYNLGKLCLREPINLRRAALDYLRQAERLLPKGSRPLKDARNYVARLEANLARLRQVPPASGDAAASAAALRQARDAKARKRWKSAEEFAERAAKADPASFEAALEWGRTCAQNGHREAALRAYDAALVLRQDSVPARAEAAQLAYDAKAYDAAAGYLRPALVVEPRNPALADLMARILYSQRRHADARVWGDYYLGLASPGPKAAAAYRKWVDSLPEE